MFVSKNLLDWLDVIHSRDLKNAQPHILNVSFLCRSTTQEGERLVPPP